MIDLGAPCPLAFTVTDSSGTPANAVTVTLTITLPDGTTVIPVVTTPPAVTGQYVYAYTTTQAGRHTVYWQAVSPDDAYTDVFDVRPAADPSILSLADAKSQLNIDPGDTSQDNDLRMWLAAITRSIERYMNTKYARRDVTQTEENYDGRALRLWEVPVISLNSLARWDGTHTWTITSDNTTDVRTDLETGIVYLVHGPHLRGVITAQFTAGMLIIPENIVVASSEFLQYVWEARRGPGSVGAGVIGPDEAMDYRQGALMPRKIRDLCGTPRPLIA